VTGSLADVINHAKFYLNRVRGFDSVGGSNFWLSHKKEKSPLTQGLNYRSACDVLYGTVAATLSFSFKMSNVRVRVVLCSWTVCKHMSVRLAEYLSAQGHILAFLLSLAKP